MVGEKKALMDQQFFSSIPHEGQELKGNQSKVHPVPRSRLLEYDFYGDAE
jgi:hypothetical protein